MKEYFLSRSWIDETFFKIRSWTYERFLSEQQKRFILTKLTQRLTYLTVTIDEKRSLFIWKLELIKVVRWLNA